MEGDLFRAVGEEGLAGDGSVVCLPGFQGGAVLVEPGDIGQALAAVIGQGEPGAAFGKSNYKSNYLVICKQIKLPGNLQKMLDI